MNVVIVGAGLGGLCLAQGLKRRGIGLTVLEADPALDSRKQGYRLNINVSGASALAACLPDSLLRLYQATSHRQLEPTVTICTASFERVFQRLADEGDGPVPPSAVDRATLRRILAAGLSGDIRYGMPVTDISADGYAICADGSKWTADLIVAADGTGSVARRCLLPGNEPVDLGTTAIYGRTPLTPQIRDLLPEPVFTGRLTGLVDGAGLMLALGAWDPRRDPGDAAAADPDCPDLGPARPYLMWALIGPDGRLGLTGTDPVSLHQRACALLSEWDSGARRAVSAARIPDTFPVRIRRSPGVPGWPSSRVTFLGDALHTMTPAGGEGANTALHDAAALAANLGLVQEGQIGLDQAIEDYETEMRAAGNDAITRSRNYGAASGSGRLAADLAARHSHPRRPARREHPPGRPRAVAGRRTHWVLIFSSWRRHAVDVGPTDLRAFGTMARRPDGPSPAPQSRTHQPDQGSIVDRRLPGCLTVGVLVQLGLGSASEALASEPSLRRGEAAVVGGRFRRFAYSVRRAMAAGSQPASGAIAATPPTARPQGRGRCRRCPHSARRGTGAVPHLPQ